MSAEHHRGNEVNRERGSILLLGIGLWVVVLSAVFVIGSLTAIHAERRDLLAQADAIALSVANAVSDASYYTGQAVSYDNAEVRNQARILLARDEDSDGVQLINPTGQRDDGVIVTLRKVVRVPFIPSFLSSISDVALTVTSQARLRTLDDVD